MNAHHHEALRKERVLERKRVALKKLSERGLEGSDQPMQYADGCKGKTPVLFTGSGNFETHRKNLEMFRVNKEGHDIRYRNRQNFAPHVDRVYPIIYPGKDNCDYTHDENRNNRIMNLIQDKYDLSRKVNGEIQMKVLLDSPDYIQPAQTNFSI